MPTSGEEHNSRLKSLLNYFIQRNASIKFRRFTISATGCQPDPWHLKLLAGMEQRKIQSHLLSIIRCLPRNSGFSPFLQQQYGHQINGNGPTSVKESWTSYSKTADRPMLAEPAPNISTRMVTDIFHLETAAVLDQEEDPVILISRSINTTKRKILPNNKTLALFWVVHRRHKYLFSLRPKTTPKTHALKFPFHPTESLSCLLLK